METLLVRLKPYDHRRGHVLRRYTYAGIKFQEERGWNRVEKSVGEHLRTIHQLPRDPHSPLAFDVCTDEEAKALDTSEADSTKVKRSATDDLKVVPARPAGAVTTESLPNSAAPSASKPEDRDTRRGKRERA